MNDIAVNLHNVSKFYKLYNSPRERLKEALHPFGAKYHSEFYALKDIFLKLKKGEVLGIVGKNGSGKSTLLKLISQILVPNKGTVQVDGTISALIELGAGFNPQFTGIENIYFYGTILGFSREEMEEKIDGIIGFADIGDFIRQPIKTYSSGMKARLAFAVATEVNPDILIIDEVLSVGDTVFKRKCFDKINTMFQDGKTVILVSHNRNSIVGLCEKAVLLDHGEIICSGESETVMREYEKLCYKQFLVTGKTEQADSLIAETRSSSPKQETAAEYTDDEIFWDPTLVAEPVLFKKSDIEFSHFGIYDLEGNKVNILMSGNTYKVKAVFLPKQDLSGDIIFAMRLTTLQGYMICWMGYPFKKNIFLEIHRNKPLEIEYLFDCNFNQGVYCIDAGLQSMVDNELFFHVSHNNAFTFRIKEDVKKRLNGNVYLNFRKTDQQ